MAYERANIGRLRPYTPGEQPPQEAAAGGGAARGSGTIKLNTNENPYPPVPAVLEAIRAVGGEALRRYPVPGADGFRRVAAEVHGLTPGQVIATNGGDELLRLAVTAFCEPSGAGGGGGVGFAEPSYSLYPVLAAIHDTPVTTVELDEGFGLPGDFAERLVGAGCGLVLVVNPHAPSGRLEPVEALGAIAERLRGRAVLLIDEAYVDFAPRDCLALVAAGSGLDNVLLLRSLSKGYSLAGLRFGYGMGHPALIGTLQKVRDSYNVDAVAQAGATAALGHRDEASRGWAAVREERSRLADALAGRGWRVYPSDANFVLAVPPGGGARRVYQSLKDRRILVRYFDLPRLTDKLRITVGTPEQNDRLLAALDDLGCGG